MTIRPIDFQDLVKAIAWPACRAAALLLSRKPATELILLSQEFFEDSRVARRW